MAARAALERSGADPARLDEVILGQVVPAGSGQAVPRQVSIGVGIPAHVGGLLINKICGSSLKAAMLAAGLIRAGDGDLYLVGGLESMTNAPFMDLKGRIGHKYGHFEMVDAAMWDGLWDHIAGWIMGEAAEFIAQEFEISRQEMDGFAVRSHRLAHEATEAGRFAEEIVPVELPGRKGQVTVFDRDESIRPDTTLDTLAKLRPAFRDDGIVTAGNSPGLNDGAAALVVVSTERAQGLRQKPAYVLAAVQGSGYRQAATVHNAPDYPTSNFKTSAPRLYAMAGLGPKDVDVLQCYENFTGGVLMSIVEHGFCPPEEVNGFFTPANLSFVGGRLPLNTSGGNLAECYMHGLELIIEAVRQIRGTSPCQVPNARVSMVVSGPMVQPVSSSIYSSEPNP